MIHLIMTEKKWKSTIQICLFERGSWFNWKRFASSAKNILKRGTNNQSFVLIIAGLNQKGFIKKVYANSATNLSNMFIQENIVLKNVN